MILTHFHYLFISSYTFQFYSFPNKIMNADEKASLQEDVEVLWVHVQEWLSWIMLMAYLEVSEKLA